MNKILTLLFSVIIIYFGLETVHSVPEQQAESTTPEEPFELSSKILAQPDTLSTAIFAGGCFWCVESDFEKLDGVSDAISGYTGGSAETANYKTVSYTETGHYEAVQVIYDSKIISYEDLVEYFWRTIDPTDAEGQFCDKGSSYRTAIFYASDDEKEALENSLARLNKNKPFEPEIVTPIIAATPFYKAEKYHQNYYKKTLSVISIIVTDVDAIRRLNNYGATNKNTI